tara:strand:+ start:1230 stop:1337 length:108 start_codon:yes stop_codon:yes gene_type:complete
MKPNPPFPKPVPDKQAELLRGQMKRDSDVKRKAKK